MPTIPSWQDLGNEWSRLNEIEQDKTSLNKIGPKFSRLDKIEQDLRR